MPSASLRRNLRSKIRWFTLSAIHTTYRISLRSSSLREPRYPLLRVVFDFRLAAIAHQFQLQARFGSVLVWPAHGTSSLSPHKNVEKEDRLPRGPHDLLRQERLLVKQATPPAEQGHAHSLPFPEESKGLWEHSKFTGVV